MLLNKLLNCTRSCFLLFFPSPLDPLHMQSDSQQQRNNNPPQGNSNSDRELTHTSLNAIHHGSISSSPLESTQNLDIIDTNHKTDSVTRNSVLFLDQNVVGPTGASMAQTTDGSTVLDREDTVPMETARTGSLIDRPDHVDDSVLQI